MGLTELRAYYPWPYIKPDLPFDPHGWCGPDHKTLLINRLDHTTQVVLELGSWLGQSTRLLLSLTPNATIICVDTWHGSTDMVTDPEATKRIDTEQLFQQFQANQWDYRDRIIPLIQDSLIGLQTVYDAGVVPDLIFFDTEHTTDHLSNELELAHKLFPITKLYGDDWKWPTVQAALQPFAITHGFEIQTSGNAWALEPLPVP